MTGGYAVSRRSGEGVRIDTVELLVEETRDGETALRITAPEVTEVLMADISDEPMTVLSIKVTRSTGQVLELPSVNAVVTVTRATPSLTRLAIQAPETVPIDRVDDGAKIIDRLACR